MQLCKIESLRLGCIWPPFPHPLGTASGTRTATSSLTPRRTSSETPSATISRSATGTPTASNSGVLAAFTTRPTFVAVGVAVLRGVALRCQHRMNKSMGGWIEERNSQGRIAFVALALPRLREQERYAQAHEHGQHHSYE